MTGKYRGTLYPEIIHIDENKFGVNNDYNEAIEFLIDEITEMDADHITYIYVDGMDNSNRTKFESMSNNNEIGIESDNDARAYVLAFLLKILIDENPHVLDGHYEEVFDKEEFMENFEDTAFVTVFRYRKKTDTDWGVEDNKMKIYDSDQIITLIRNKISEWRKNYDNYMLHY